MTPRCFLSSLLLEGCLAIWLTGAAARCGTQKITMAGSSYTGMAVQAWADGYVASCPNQKIEIDATNGTEAGLQGVCADPGSPVKPFIDAANYVVHTHPNLPPDDKEVATLSKLNGFTFDCVASNRQIIKVFVGEYPGVLVVPKRLEKCIEALGGGFTVTQARWIFSADSIQELDSYGWEPDPADFVVGDLVTLDNSFRKWSYLSSSPDCPNTNIFPVSSENKRVESLLHFLLADTPAGDRVVPYAKTIQEAIQEGLDFVGVTSLDYLDQLATDTFAVVKIKNPQGEYVSPLETKKVQRGQYRPFSMKLESMIWKQKVNQIKHLFAYGYSVDGDSRLADLGVVPLSEPDKMQMRTILDVDGGLDLSSVTAAGATTVTPTVPISPIITGASVSAMPAVAPATPPGSCTLGECPPCEVCGEGFVVGVRGQHVNDPNATRDYTCGDFEFFGLIGFIPPERCTDGLAASFGCECTVGSDPPVAPPTVAPTTLPLESCSKRANVPAFCPYTADNCCTPELSSLLILPDGSGNRVPCWEARHIYDNATSSAYNDDQCACFQNSIQNGGGVGCGPQCPTDAPVDLGPCVDRVVNGTGPLCDLLFFETRDCCPSVITEKPGIVISGVADSEPRICSLVLADYNGDGSAFWTDAQCIQAKSSIEANAFEYSGCVCPDDPRLLTMPPSLSPTGTLAPTTATPTPLPTTPTAPPTTPTAPPTTPTAPPTRRPVGPYPACQVCPEGSLVVNQYDPVTLEPSLPIETCGDAQLFGLGGQIDSDTCSLVRFATQNCVCGFGIFLPTKVDPVIPLSFRDYVTSFMAKKTCTTTSGDYYGANNDVLNDLDESLPFQIAGFLDNQNPFIKCDPRKCQSEGEDARPYCEYLTLAVAPTSLEQSRGRERASAFRDFIYEKYPELLDERIPFLHSFVSLFESNVAIDDYVTSETYGDEDHPKLAFAVTFSNGIDENDFHFFLRMNSTNFNQPEKEATPAARTTPPVDISFRHDAYLDNACHVRGAPDQGNLTNSCTGQYLYNGAITIQRLVQDWILYFTGAKELGFFVAEHGVQFVAFPTPLFLPDQSQELYPTYQDKPLVLSLADYNTDVAVGSKNPILFNKAGSTFTCQPGRCLVNFAGTYETENKGVDENGNVLPDVYSYCGNGFFAVERFSFNCSIDESDEIGFHIKEYGADMVAVEAVDVTFTSLRIIKEFGSHEASVYGAISFTHDYQSTSYDGRDTYADSAVSLCERNILNHAYLSDKENYCSDYGGTGYVIHYNVTAIHASILFQALADEALLRQAFNGTTSYKITAGVYPLKLTQIEVNIPQSVTSNGASDMRKAGSMVGLLALGVMLAAICIEIVASVAAQ